MRQRVLFYLNKGKIQVLPAMLTTIFLCGQNGIEPVFREEDRETMNQVPELNLSQCRFTTDPIADGVTAIFSFGGDGTVLSAMDRYAETDLPILGIHLGRMGFLLETEMKDLPVALERFSKGEYSIERRMMLQMCISHDPSFRPLLATNEVSISRGISQRMIAFDVAVDNKMVDHYIADGLMVSAPTGSTGYSLSAGGPIVSPDVNCMIINPICPHTLQSRPIIVSKHSHVKVTLRMKEEREGIQLSVDGLNIGGLQNGQSIEVCRSSHDGQLIRFEDKNFYALLKSKLSQWSL